MNTQTVFCNLIVAGLVVLASHSAHAAGNPTAGKEKFQACAECHGPTSQTNTTPQSPVPKLGGQHAQYIVSSLEAYISGDRQNAVMQDSAGQLSDQDKEDIAAYVGQFELKKLPVPEAGQRPAIQKQIENCRVCHGEAGNSFVPDYPRLNGQNEAYLLKSLKDYKTGIRKNPTMVYVAKDLSDQELIDIAAYYAHQKEGLTVIGH